jgi:hypothetical protein
MNLKVEDLNGKGRLLQDQLTPDGYQFKGSIYLMSLYWESPG